MTLRVGILGAGQVGERHAVGFAATAEAEVVGVADLVPARARALTGRFGGTAVTDWRRLMDLDLDILVVCLPHNNHVEPTEAAAAQGVHVLMEKPIATTMEDGQRIVDLVRDTLDETPPELVSDLMETGICLAGGGGLLKGLAERISEETHIRAWVAQDSLTCVARGAGMASRHACPGDLGHLACRP